MTDDTDEFRTIDPKSLDLYTVREIKHAVRGFPETEASPTDLDEFRAGKHSAYSAIMGMLTRFEGKIEETQSTDDELRREHDSDDDPRKIRSSDDSDDSEQR